MRSDRLQSYVEAYIALRNRTQTGADDGVAVETFALADAIRGHSVQQALAASSARAQIKDPALAELVRQEQDLSKQVNAQLGTLNNVLALPSGQRDENGVAGAQRVDREFARRARQAARRYRQAISELRQSDRPEAAVASTRSRRPSSPTRRCCRSISAATPASSGRCRRTGKVAFAAIPATLGRHRDQDSGAAQGAGAGGGDDLRHSAVRSQPRLRPLQPAAQAGRGGLEAGEEPDRGHQRRARPAAAVAVADRAGRRTSPSMGCCSPAIATCRGSRARMR